jgi:hypothetical protein
MRGVSLLALATATMMVTACGGGGVASTPTPPPTTPTPPSPPPPPSVPNTSLLSLTSSESFVNDAVTGSALVNLNNSAGTASGALTTTVFSYDLASRGYTLSTGGRSITFLPSEIDAAQSNAATTVYVKTNGGVSDSLTLTKPGTSGRFTYQYVGAAFWQHTVQTATTISGTFDAVAYGIASPNSGVPRTGRAEYGVDLIGVESVPGNIVAMTGSGKMQVDFVSGAIITHGTMGTALMPNGAFSSEAKLSSTANSFAGNFRFYDFGEFVGQLNGRFYGPNAQEVGSTYYATQADGRIAIGTIIGRGSAVTATNTSVRTPTVNEFFANDAATMKASLTGAPGTNNSGTFSNRSASITPLLVNYDATTRAYTLIASDRSQYFDPASRARGTINEYFGDPNPRTFFYSNFLPVTQYVKGSRWYTATGQTTSNDLVFTDVTFGVKTPDAALPRTGKAGYNIALIGSAADADSPNLTDFGGTGVLTADLATGAITASGAMTYREDYYIAGRAAKTNTGQFNLASTLSSSANSFTGTINFDGIGSYSGPLAGRFYGPAAEEVGAAFSATDGIGGSASGVLTGIKDPDIFRVIPSIAGLTQNTAFTGIVINDPSNPSPQRFPYFIYDPATQTYSFYPSSPTNAAAIAYQMGPAQKDAAASNTTFTVYRGSGPAGQFTSTNTYVTKLFNPAVTNPKFVLTYTSFGEIAITNTAAPSPFPQAPSYIVYGIQTPAAQVPKSGSATYTGIVFGSGSIVNSPVTLDGTSSLSANFGSSTFTSILNITAKDTASGQLRILAPINFNGNIFNSLVLTGNNFEGNFYGQNAAEYGATFRYSNFDPLVGSTSLVGVTVGKK